MNERNDCFATYPFENELSTVIILRSINLYIEWSNLYIECLIQTSSFFIGFKS